MEISGSTAQKLEMKGPKCAASFYNSCPNFNGLICLLMIFSKGTVQQLKNAINRSVINWENCALEPWKFLSKTMQSTLPDNTLCNMVLTVPALSSTALAWYHSDKHSNTCVMNTHAFTSCFQMIWLFKYVATKWKSVLTLHFPTRYFADFIIDNFNTVLCRFLLYLRNFRSILVLILWKKGRSKKHSPSKGILKLKPCWTDMTCSLKNTITSSSTVFQLQDMSCHSFWWWKTLVYPS